jgi:uncharacterized protein (DUF2267 family)
VQYNEFIGQVHNRAEMATTQEAVAATRAVLRTLAERLMEDVAENLAAQLPQELQGYLDTETHAERFSLDEFFTRVAAYESVDLPKAAYHARVVTEVLDEATTPGIMEEVRGQFPATYASLFEAGSEGDMETG